MSKLRSDAIWNRLTTEHRTQVEDWFLEQNLSVTEVHERACKELGLACSRATIGRFYSHLLNLRAIDDVAEEQGLAGELAQMGGRMEELRSSSMKLILARLLEKAKTRAELKEVTALGRLMLQSEEREIQRDRLKLARERFQFRVAKAAMAALPMLDEMSQEDEDRELARIEAIKKKIFGGELEGLE
jgi:hypothetical protein